MTQREMAGERSQPAEDLSPRAMAAEIHLAAPWPGPSPNIGKTHLRGTPHPCITWTYFATLWLVEQYLYWCTLTGFIKMFFFEKLRVQKQWRTGEIVERSECVWLSKGSSLYCSAEQCRRNGEVLT